MTFGEAGTEGARVHNLKDVEAILDVFQAHGHNEVGLLTDTILNSALTLRNRDHNQIDTARFYSNGASEEYLGKIGWQKRGILMETKLYATAVRNSTCFFSSKSRKPDGFALRPWLTYEKVQMILI